jgi:hypothetical protein
MKYDAKNVPELSFDPLFSVETMGFAEFLQY